MGKLAFITDLNDMQLIGEIEADNDIPILNRIGLLEVTNPMRFKEVPGVNNSETGEPELMAACAPVLFSAPVTRINTRFNSYFFIDGEKFSDLKKRYNDAVKNYKTILEEAEKAS